jgi:hypothetical protein
MVRKAGALSDGMVFSILPLCLTASAALAQGL